MGYKYDIFISYKRDEGVLEWLEEQFIPKLKKRLQGFFSEEVKIFYDRTLNEGYLPKTAIEDALKHSKILIPILAPPYFRSQWCSAEWKTFEAREKELGLPATGSSLRIPIRLLDCESYGTHMGVSSPLPKEFNKYHHTGEAWQRSDDFYSFNCEMQELCDTIRSLLRNVQEHCTSWPLVSYEEAGELCPQMCQSLHTPLKL